LKTWPLSNPETSVSNQLTLRNNPEDGRIRFKRGGSVRSRIGWTTFPHFRRFCEQLLSLELLAVVVWPSLRRLF
jgi:hypothetical protein